ncbi:hypothetical protein [Nonomuraea insulae]|uniref:Pyrrolo-quinoline quinone repeat domain-containing protein n=1 Tax=Nonomuraea insulae TaxID=1616787 RepID=A0ABW1CB18_9ACTN
MRLARLIAAGALVLACAGGSQGAQGAWPGRPSLGVAWSVGIGDLGTDGLQMSVDVATVGGRSLVATPSAGPYAIRVLDAATGRAVRTFPIGVPYSFAQVDARFVGDLLAVRTRELAGERITVHDPVSGRTKWSRLLPLADVPISPYLQRSAQTRSGIVWAAGDGLRGIDAETGRDLWTLPLPGDCPEYQLLTSEIPILLGRCPGTSALRGVDPRAGRVTWTRTVPVVSADDDPTVLVSPTGLVEISEDGVFTAVDARGRVAARLPDAWPHVAGPSAARSGTLTLLVHSEGGARVMAALRDGRPLWRRTLKPRDLPGTSEGVLPEAGYLTARHAVDTLGSDLAPHLIEVVSPADGRRVVLALPFDAQAGAIVGTTARDVLTYEMHPGGARLSAYTFHDGVGAPRLPAVPPERWPDACALLPPGALPGYVPAPATSEHLGLRWPRPNVCTFLPPDEAAAQVRVAVTWVAETSAGLLRLAGTKAAADPETVRLGEGAYLSSADDRDGRLTSAWAAGGRVLATVQAVGDPALTRRAALLVASHLRDP